MDRGAWRATVHGVSKSRTPLTDFHFREKVRVKRQKISKELEVLVRMQGPLLYKLSETAKEFLALPADLEGIT